MSEDNKEELEKDIKKDGKEKKEQREKKYSNGTKRRL